MNLAVWLRPLQKVGLCYPLKFSALIGFAQIPWPCKHLLLRFMHETGIMQTCRQCQSAARLPGHGVCRDGGVVVDGCMRTSAAGVYAAGDVCRAAALEAASSHWFQMRLWTQAHSRRRRLLLLRPARLSLLLSIASRP